MISNTELCELFVKYHSDKCPQVGHSYSPHYYDLLKDGKETFLNILEIGIGNNELMKPLYGENYIIGGSLKAFNEFFINANIFGVDIRKDVLFSEGRIKCFYTDQSNSKELHKTIKEIKKINDDENLKFDLIIDDGSHITNHMILSFNTLGEYLKSNGIYIIEDIKREELNVFINLELNGFEIIKIHRGNTGQDDFVAFRKK
jgi:hypothetical protein